MKLSRSKCAVMNFPKNMLCLQGIHCFIIGLLRHCSVLVFVCLFLCFLRHYTISSRFPLFLYLFVTSPYHLFKVSIVWLSVCYVTALFYASTVSSSVSYVTILSLQGFHCFIICLLRHCSILGLAGPYSSAFFVTSPDYLCKVSIVLLSVYYVSALF